jgi:ABC-type phosphate transport system substrate-binding protein
MACLMMGGPGLAPAQEYAVDYQVIINASNSTRSLTRDQLKSIFLKKMVKWDSGAPVVPVDQMATSPVRVVFTKIVHGKPVSAIASYWQQQIFAGREVPPVEKEGDAAVVAFVKANPGAVGYVTGGTSAPGTRLLTIR